MAMGGRLVSTSVAVLMCSDHIGLWSVTVTTLNLTFPLFCNPKSILDAETLRMVLQQELLNSVFSVEIIRRNMHELQVNRLGVFQRQL